jgi:large subunit ribosomal protein L27e
VLAGRYAGKKAIVVAAKDATKKRPYAHALIAGLVKSPRAVSKSMSKSKITHKSSIKVFVKNINVAHIMPTRYSATDIKLVDIVKPQKVENAGAGRNKVVAQVRRAFASKYILRGAKNSTGVQYFFQKLRF